MAKKTEVQKFKTALKNRFFNVSDSCYSYLMLNPSAYRDQDGNRILTGNIGVSIFGGSNTPAGSLGCVSMRLQGKIIKKGHRNAHSDCVLSKAFVAKDADHAIAEFEAWNKQIQIERKKWKLMI